MPASATPIGPNLKKILSHLGQQIRARRKGINVSAVATAEAAGISRMTLNRIERGEASVTLGAYLSVISVLGLEFKLVDPKLNKKGSVEPALENDTMIPLSDYPQLKQLAWQLKKTKIVSLEEALSLYERNWRHINLNKMGSKERKLIQNLLAHFGKERMLV